MKQNVPSRKAELDAQEAQIASERSRQSIDEWLAAAVTEQTRRAEVRRDVAGRPPVEASAPAPEPSQPARGSSVVASWMSGAQDQLADMSRAVVEPRPAAPAAQAPRPEPVDEKPAAPASSARFKGDDEAIRGLENRIREIAERLESPRPIGRRGLSPTQEVEAAVAEIRSRQNDLGVSAQASAPQPAPPAAPVAPPPQAQPVTTAAPPPARPAAAPPAAAPVTAPSAVAPTPVASPVAARRPEPRESVVDSLSERTLDALRQEIVRLHGSMDDLARRDDVASIRHSVSELADRFDAASASQPAASEKMDHLLREMDVVAHKLDIVSASGIDPTAIDAMSREVGELRDAIAGVATRDDLASVAADMADLRRDLSAVGERQAPSEDLVALRGLMEELRAGLVRPERADGEDPSTTRMAVEATRDELQAVSHQIANLADKIERIERSNGDPEAALEQIERQIAGIAAQIGERDGREPEVAALGLAVADMMGEVAAWRHTLADVAERAARRAVEETLSTWSPPAAESRAEVATETSDPAEEAPRTERPQAPVLPPIAGLESRTVGRDDGVTGVYASTFAQPASPPTREPDPVGGSDETLRRMNDAIALDTPVGGPKRPEAPAGQPEILLEPGAERPRIGRAPEPQAVDTSGEAHDVKASFIAAARRAAQAASESGKKSGRVEAPVRTAAAVQPKPATRGIGSVLQRLRRPLLLSAAAIVVAVGGYQIWRDETGSRVATSNRAASTGVTAPPVIESQPASRTRVATNVEPPEPSTTQSVPEPRPAAAAAPSAPAASAIDRPADVVAASQPAAQADIAPQGSTNVAATAPAAGIPAAAPSKTETAALPSSDGATRQPAGTPQPAPNPIVALRQASLAGDPVALFEMGARTMEGRGVARDPKAAVALFEKAAEKNLAPAQYRVGNAYEKGVGVTRDIEVARRWYMRAAENGNTRAMHNLAVLVAEGSGGKPDYAAAVGWFQRAAEQGVRDSQFNLAVLFARGLGTSQDLVKSYTWFAIAASQGDEEAARKREEVGTRLPAADLARAKAAAERWRATPANPSANEVVLPARWSSLPASTTARKA